MNEPMPWWVRGVVILGALLMALGAALALLNPTMLVGPHEEINEAARIYAGYMASRNIALALLLVALLSVGAKRALSHLVVLVALVQFLDAVIDCAEGRWVVAPGVLVFGIVFLLAAARLCRYPFWKIEAWT